MHVIVIAACKPIARNVCSPNRATRRRRDFSPKARSAERSRFK